jgi:hypothetical protein
MNWEIVAEAPHAVVRRKGRFYRRRYEGPALHNQHRHETAARAITCAALVVESILLFWKP